MSDVSSVSSQKTIEQILADQAKKSKESRNTGELGKDDFLKLLITQVQHQDPMNPSSDTDFIAQMAQFSALEQMQNLNNSFSYSMGFSMMGKYISAEITDEDGEVTQVTGKVESVRMSAGKVIAMVDGQEVPIEKITQVSDADPNSAAGNIMDFSGIIGLLSKAYVTNADGKKGTIEGIISSVKKETDGMYIYLDEVDLEPKDLDMTGYADMEAYVAANTGKEITVKFKDPNSGLEFRVKGTLRQAYEEENGDVHFVLDKVKSTVDSVYATEKVDLLSTEQMLLGEILKALKNMGTPSDSNTEAPDDSTDDTVGESEEAQTP